MLLCTCECNHPVRCSAYSTVDRLGKQATTRCAKGHKRSGRANPYVVGSLTAAARVSPESTAPRAVSAKHSRTAIGALWFALVEAAGVRSWGGREYWKVLKPAVFWFLSTRAQSELQCRNEAHITLSLPVHRCR